MERFNEKLSRTTISKLILDFTILIKFDIQKQEDNKEVQMDRENDKDKVQ